MTILQALEEANNIKGIKGLSFANLKEFASFQDSFNFVDWPRNIIVPLVVDGTFSVNPRPDEFINIQGWMVTRINQDTNDYRSVKIEPDYISPMRAAARQFLTNLVASDLTNPQVQNVTYRISPEYQWLTTHLFGVSYTMRWPVRVC